MTHNEKIVEAVAESLWQAESQRAADRARLTPWSEESEKTREGWRFLARAAITAYQAEAWQDVSTAPKEGHVLLFASQIGEASDVHWRGSFATTGYWDGVDEAWCATGSNWTGPFLEPTHWRPIPPPPVGSDHNHADASPKIPNPPAPSGGKR